MTKIITIITDCDNTLMPDAPSLLLKDNGINPQDFWDKISDMVDDKWDPPIAWMTEIVNLMNDGKIKQNTNAKLKEFGASIEVYPGASTFIDEMNSTLGNELDVKIEGYVVSSGIESIMKGAKISQFFTDIFGGSLYEKNGV